MNEPELSAVHMTARGAAGARALHLLRDGEPKIFRDDFAIALSGWSADEILRAADAGLWPASTATWVLRTRFTEDRLTVARHRGVGQYVILGAGLDSFALRHVDSLHDLTVYEVDDPPMQAWKRWRLEQLNVPTPAALRWVPCDFERRALHEALADAGFRGEAPAFVSWLAVTQYLTRDAIGETLRWVGRLHPGSEVVLTYVTPGPDAEVEKQRFAPLGIRFETFFTTDEIAAVLADAGLGDIEPFTPEQAQQTYFRDRDDGLHAPTVEQLIVARTAG